MLEWVPAVKSTGLEVRLSGFSFGSSVANFLTLNELRNDDNPRFPQQ